jgi:hypothetical protein
MKFEVKLMIRKMGDSDEGKTIIAPHPDDEVIGCYSLLEENDVGRVVYVTHDGQPERYEEVRNLADFYGFEAVMFEDFEEFDETMGEMVYRDDEVVVPNINDEHQLHKQVNRWAKQNLDWNQLEFYTIDKNVDREFIGNEMAEEKRDLLNSFYPSQSKLWEHDDKYVLFEGISSSDDKRYIEVSTDFRGFHAWSEAPEPVEFLKNQHRHTFEVDVEIQVDHDDRELEFFMFQRELDDIIEERLGENQNEHGELELGGMSCEMIADEIARGVMREYEDREFAISVSEDGEVGAKVKYNGMR